MNNNQNFGGRGGRGMNRGRGWVGTSYEQLNLYIWWEILWQGKSEPARGSLMKAFINGKQTEYLVT